MKKFPPNLAFRRPLFCCSLWADLCTVIAVGMLAIGAAPLHPQTSVALEVQLGSKSAVSSHASKTAAIKSVRMVQEKDGPAVEILSTKPLLPSIQAISDPDRLVIDLPNARLETPQKQKRISIQADQISSLSADQLQQNPPVVRLVVDLLAPRAHTWHAAGNRLVVSLGRNPNGISSSPFEAPAVPSLSSAPQPLVTAVRAAGPLALARNDAESGSSITTGPDTAVLRLSSGGEVHVCPGTTLAVTPSQNRHNLMLSMNAGALETHFALDASSDSVITPDFRILLAGPGEFHYAISADNEGNTCVRALPGNTAPVTVTELLGDGTYQVKATDQLVFRSGQLNRVDMAVPLECGCPPPRDAPLRATNDLPTQSPAQKEALAAAPLDAFVAPNELHVQIEAPFVFHATGPPPVPVEDVRALPLGSRPRAAPALAAPLPPRANGKAKPAGTETASANQAPARRFFRKVGGFFAALFR